MFSPQTACGVCVCACVALDQLKPIQDVAAMIAELQHSALSAASLPPETRLKSLVRECCCAWCRRRARCGAYTVHDCPYLCACVCACVRVCVSCCQGLAMSGFSQKRRQQELVELLESHGLADHYAVMNDSVGSAFTVSDKGRGHREHVA